MKINTEQLFAEVYAAFQAILQPCHFKKGEIIQHAGHICRNLYMVQSGLLRAYYYVDGKDATAHFADKGGAITAPDSFIKGETSKYYIEAVEDSVAYVVHRDVLEDYLIQNPSLERITRQFTEAIYLDLLKRIEDIIFLTAKERYKSFSEKNPAVLQHANLGHISSYLGISQETLSRLRKQKE